MANILFANNASSLLAASIDDNDTTVQVSSGEGALFPSPTGGQYFVLALVNGDGDFELCHCTGRSSDLLTVVRGQDGTVAQSWTLAETRAELRLTKGIMEHFLQLDGGVMEGDLDMNGNEIVDAELTGSTVITGGQTVGTSIRGALNETGNEISVPSNGDRATAGGADILCEGDDLIALLDSGGVITFPSLTGIRLEDGAYFRIYNSADADYVSFSHNGTDFLATGFQTTNFNFVDMSVDIEDNLLVRGTIQVNGVVTGPVNTSAAEVGYRGVPVVTENGNHTLELSDAGKMIRKASGGSGETITIPANSSVAFPIGTMIAISNDGGGILTIAITTDTLIAAEDGSTGSVTLADDGMAVLTKVASTTWKVVGTGLTT